MDEIKSCEGKSCPCGSPATQEVKGTCMCDDCAASMSGDEQADTSNENA